MVIDDVVSIIIISLVFLVGFAQLFTTILGNKFGAYSDILSSFFYDNKY